MSRPIRIRAGRCVRTEGTNTVVPSSERGLITLSSEDGLWQFTYKNLDNGQIEDPLILLPEDAEFRKAPVTTSPSGRIYVLTLASSGAVDFYWMQDPDESKDRTVERAFGAILSEEGDVDAVMAEASSLTSNLPAAPAPAPAAAPTVPQTASELAPAPASPQSAAAEPSTAQHRQMDLTEDNIAAIRRALGIPHPGPGGQEEGPDADFTLPDILNAPFLAPIVRELPQADLEPLFQCLPSDLPQNKETLLQVIESPDFRRSAGALHRALRMGVLGGIMPSWGLPVDAGIGVEPYLKAVEEQAQNGGAGSGGSGVGGDSMETD